MVQSTLADQRKIHETNSDRVRQEEAVKAFCLVYHKTYKMTSQEAMLPFDARIFDGSLAALAEVKYRATPADYYPTFRVDKQKIWSLSDAAFDAKVRPLLIVSWITDVRWLDVRTKFFYFREAPQLMKRAGRDEVADVALEIALDHFTRCQS